MTTAATLARTTTGIIHRGGISQSMVFPQGLGVDILRITYPATSPGLTDAIVRDPATGYAFLGQVRTTQPAV